MIVKEVYRREQFRSSLRVRIEAAVAGTEIYQQLRVIELKEETVSLFSNDNDLEGAIMPKIEQNFPNAQIGAVTATGEIQIGAQAFSQGPSAEQINAIAELLVRFASLTNSAVDRREGEQLALELKKEPKKNVVDRAIGWVKTIASGTSASATLVNAGVDLVGELENFSGMM